MNNEYGALQLKYIICMMIAIFYVNGMAQDSTVVEIFMAKSLQYGYVYQEDVIMEDNGRAISSTIQLPVIEGPVETGHIATISSPGFL